MTNLLELTQSQSEIFDGEALEQLYEAVSDGRSVDDDWTFWKQDVPRRIISVNGFKYDVSMLTPNAKAEIFLRLDEFIERVTSEKLVDPSITENVGFLKIQIGYIKKKLDAFPLVTDTRSVGLIPPTTFQENGVVPYSATLFETTDEDETDAPFGYKIRWIALDRKISQVSVFYLDDNTSNSKRKARKLWAEANGFDKIQYCASEQTVKLEASDRRQRSNAWDEKRRAIQIEARDKEIREARDAMSNDYDAVVSDAYGDADRFGRRKIAHDTFFGKHVPAIVVMANWEYITEHGMAVYNGSKRVIGIWSLSELGALSDEIELAYGIGDTVETYMGTPLRVSLAPTIESGLFIQLERPTEGFGVSQTLTIKWYTVDDTELVAVRDSMRESRRLDWAKHEINVYLRDHYENGREVVIKGWSFDLKLGASDTNQWTKAIQLATKIGNAWKAKA